MAISENALVFECENRYLVGIIHGAGVATTGVLIIVGGPQYRVGSHRQFLLLARYLAQNGIPVLRFDYRGMGDSGGDIRTFEDIGKDIRAAIDSFFEHSPGLESVVLWGLCDAASAAVFYAQSDPRVEKMVLLNPWVRTEAGEAKAYLKHYYIQRLFSMAFWQKVLSGKFELGKSLGALAQGINKSCASSPSSQSVDGEVETDSGSSKACDMAPLPERMYEGLKRFQGEVNIIISGDDLTAAEFEDMVKASKAWRKLIKAKAVQYHFLPEANHTFSKQAWRDEVAEQTLHWVMGEHV